MTGEMLVPDASGHSRIQWNSGVIDEVDAARTMFDSLIKKGYTAFKMDKEGNKEGYRINEFDPKIEKMIMVPRIQGG